MECRIGTAGWSIPRPVAGCFPAGGSPLERYAARFNAAEINSSFHRAHRQSTWERWRDSVPGSFRFSVKVPKEITHQRKLEECGELVTDFLRDAALLGDRLAVVLLQLPPKLAFDAGRVAPFLELLAGGTSARVVCEPRHDSWLERDADQLLERLGIARVAADPSKPAGFAVPGGWRGLSYWRLHGSPVMYRSSYADRIGDYARALAADLSAGRETWCIFDNTASSAATGDALMLAERLAGNSVGEPNR